MMLMGSWAMDGKSLTDEIYETRMIDQTTRQQTQARVG